MNQPSGVPAASKSHTLRNVLIAVGVLAVLCCGGVAFGAYKVITTVREATAPARDVVNRFASDLESGDTADAYTLLCSSTRFKFTRAQLAEIVAVAPRVKSHSIVGVSVADQNGKKSGTVSVSLNDDRGDTEHHTFVVVEEDDGWKVCGDPY